MVSRNFLVGLIAIVGLGGSVAFSQETISPLTKAEVLTIIKQHTKTQVAKLKVVSVSESHRHIFENHRIFGYPIVGNLKTLNARHSTKLGSLLGDKNNYSDARIRCRNRYFHGVRFNRGLKKVEFAIGIPCNQVLIGYRVNGEVKRWGSVIGPDTLKKIIQLLGK